MSIDTTKKVISIKVDGVSMPIDDGVSLAPTSVKFTGFLGDTLTLTELDTKNIEDMSQMFRRCSNLTSLNLSSFNTSKVTTTASMFQDCSSLTSLSLINFNTSNVTNMFAMFRGCSSLTALDLTSFDTFNVIDMGQMFQDCSSLNMLDLSSFDFSNVTISSNYRNMFYGVPNDCLIWVKNPTSKAWIEEKFPNLTNVQIKVLATYTNGNDILEFYSGDEISYNGTYGTRVQLNGNDYGLTISGVYYHTTVDNVNDTFNGLSVANGTITFITDYPIPDNPAYPNLTFPYTLPSTQYGQYIIEGFYYDQSYTTKYDSSTITLTESQPNVTFYVKWSETVALTCVINNTTETYYIPSGSPYTPPTPVISGYIFEGWFDDGTFTNEITMPITITTNATIYAKMTVNVLQNTYYGYNMYGNKQQIISGSASTCSIDANYFTYSKFSGQISNDTGYSFMVGTTPAVYDNNNGLTIIVIPYSARSYIGNDVYLMVNTSQAREQYQFYPISGGRLFYVTDDSGNQHLGFFNTNSFGDDWVYIDVTVTDTNSNPLSISDLQSMTSGDFESIIVYDKNNNQIYSGV